MTLLGYVVNTRPDTGLCDLDALSRRYTGEPYGKRQLECVTALVEIDRWHAWGAPAAWVDA